MPKNRRSKYTRRKNGTWQTSVVVGYDEDGKPNRKHIYAKSKQKLAEKEAELRNQLAAGTYSDTTMTLAAYLKTWLETKSHQVKPTTLRSYEKTIQRYVLPLLGGVQLRKLSPMQIQNALQEIAEVSGARTSNLTRTILFGAMKQAVRWHLRPSNPVEGTSRIKETKRVMLLWSQRDALRFLREAEHHRLYALFHLALATGMRKGELIGIQWDDIDGNVLHVQRSVNTNSGKPTVSTPKTERGTRRIHLSDEDLRILQEHRERQEAERAPLGEAWPDTGHVFVSTIGTLLNGSNLSRILHQLQEEACVRVTRFHDLRHFHVSLLIAAGIDPKTIADRVGHSDINFTMNTYGHIFEAQREAAALPLTDMLTGDDE